MDSIPYKTENGLWNCSVPYFPNFRPHLACNLKWECVGAEDERACPYSACHTGGVTIGQGCYVIRQEAVNYVTAKVTCKRLGGYLASFNTQEELDDVRHAIRAHGPLKFLMHTACWAKDSVVFGKKRDTWDIPTFLTCSAPLTSLPPSFECSDGTLRVPYTLVCDYRQDCQDNSDEDFCVFPTCTQGRSLQCGAAQQCIKETGWCDYWPDCVNGWDELDCDLPEDFIYGEHPRPIIVTFPHGKRRMEPIADVSMCPETHFLCHEEEFCMPVFVRCNGVYDCPGREDEEDCSTYTCPDFYRCRASTVCLHPDHVCDKVYQCPQRDDELLCELKCPDNCTCHGLAFNCTGVFAVQQYLDLRYLHAAGSGLIPQHLSDHLMLVHLSLAGCYLTQMTVLDFPNLHSVDFSNNKLRDVRVEQLKDLPRLRALFLAGNPLTSLFTTNATRSVTFPTFRTLDLSRVFIENLDVSVFAPFRALRILNLTDCGVLSVLYDGFQSLTNIRELYLSGCPLVSFRPDVFRGLSHLETLHAQNYKLCCSSVHPDGVSLIDCQAPFDEISSCDALLRSHVYRIFLTIFATLTLTGNLGSFIFRLLFERGAKKKPAFGIFVVHLCISDFLMGVYLAIIGLADYHYLGSYLWNDVLWKRSAVCQVAGFVCLLSNEVSAFIICLITLDRFLVLRFPFSQLHFRRKSATVACAGVWTVGIVLAVMPLFPTLSHWEFYSNTGICVPLPVTRSDFDGHNYAFGIMIVVNFVLFMLIAAGQVSIFLSVRTNSMIPSDASRKSQDLNIARRLITIALSDFLCWFPIGLLGLLASQGTPVSGEVNVGMAIFVLPLNSAINPFLYTINIILERTRKHRDDKILKLIQDDLKCDKDID